MNTKDCKRELDVRPRDLEAESKAVDMFFAELQKSIDLVDWSNIDLPPLRDEVARIRKLK
jgi:hypothetical protein